MIDIVLSLSLLAQPAPLTTGDVVGHARAANGRLDADRAYREVLVEDDGNGRTTTTIDRHGDDFVSMTRSGGVVTARGRVNGQGWFQDANGIVFLSSGVHDGENAGGAAQGTSDLVDALRIAPLAHIGSHDAYVVERKRADGLVTRYSYDAETYVLLQTETIRRNGDTSKTEYADYRKVGAANVAFSRTWHDSLGNHGATTVESYNEIPLADARIGVPPNSPTFSTPTSGALDLDATFTRENQILIPVTIQGHRMDFMLDSGDAAGMSIDPGAASEAGLTVTNRKRASIGGAVDVARATAEEVSIGGLHANHVTFSVVPMGMRYGFSKAVGLIGSDFFGSNIVRIDYPHQRVTVIPASSFDRAAAGDPVRVQLDDGWVRVPTWFDGRRANLVLDTGSFATFLDHAFATSIGLGQAAAHEGDLRINFLGGDVGAGWYDTKNIIFAGTEFKRGRILVAKQHDSTATEGYDGILGPDVFSQFAITFDYDDSVIYVK